MLSVTAASTKWTRCAQPSQTLAGDRRSGRAEDNSILVAEWIQIGCCMMVLIWSAAAFSCRLSSAVVYIDTSFSIAASIFTICITLIIYHHHHRYIIVSSYLLLLLLLLLIAWCLCVTWRWRVSLLRCLSTVHLCKAITCWIASTGREFGLMANLRRRHSFDADCVTFGWLRLPVETTLNL